MSFGQRCRYYHVSLSPEATKLVFALKMEFITRGVSSPRPYSGGPDSDRDGWTFVSFFLNEEVCDEFEQRMGIHLTSRKHCRQIKR